MDDDDESNPYVKIGDCRDRHTKLDLALFGVDGRGGIVQDLAEIKTLLKTRWTTRDKAAIIVALITSITAIIIAFLK